MRKVVVDPKDQDEVYRAQEREVAGAGKDPVYATQQDQVRRQRTQRTGR
jgi:hypothetical protein